MAVFPYKNQSVQKQGLLSFTQELEHGALLHAVLLCCLLYSIGLLFFGDIMSTLMRSYFFLIYKITGTSDNSFTMTQLQKCNNLLQEADRSCYV